MDLKVEGVNFVSWYGHGDVSPPSPGRLADTYWNVFSFQVDGTATQNFIDAILNQVAPEDVSYRLALPFGGVTFQATGALTAPSQPFGRISYHEMSLWLPLIEHRKDGAERLVCWLPYVFPDAIIPLASGREGWGFNKSLAQLVIEDANFECRTTLFKELSSLCPGEFETLVAVRPATGGGWLRELENLAGDAVTGLKDLLGQGTLQGDVGLVAKIIIDLFESTFHVVDILQLRQPMDQSLAVFQALTDCPMTVTHRYGAKLLPGPWTVHVTNCASHQIITDLGLPTDADGNGVVPVILGMQQHVDFECTTRPFIYRVPIL